MDYDHVIRNGTALGGEITIEGGVYAGATPGQSPQNRPVDAQTFATAAE